MTVFTGTLRQTEKTGIIILKRQNLQNPKGTGLYISLKMNGANMKMW